MDLTGKLSVLLQEKKAYEAEQLAVTVFKRKLREKKESEACNVLFDTSLALLELGDDAAGGALAEELINHLRGRKVAYGGEWETKMLRLASAFPKEGKKEPKEQKEDKERGDAFWAYCETLIKWGEGQARRGLVEEFCKRRRWGEAQQMALRAEGGGEAGDAVLERVVRGWQQDSDTQEAEKDMIGVRGMLEALSKGKKTAAKRVLDSCCSSAAPSPLENCARYVWMTVDMRPPNARDMLGELCGRYRPSLERDPLLGPLVVAVADKYFPDRPLRGGAGGGDGAGGLMRMLSGLMGGGGAGHSAAPPPNHDVD